MIQQVQEILDQMILYGINHTLQGGYLWYTLTTY